MLMKISNHSVETLNNARMKDNAFQTENSGRVNINNLMKIMCHI